MAAAPDYQWQRAGSPFLLTAPKYYPASHTAEFWYHRLPPPLAAIAHRHHARYREDKLISGFDITAVKIRAATLLIDSSTAVPTATDTREKAIKDSMSMLRRHYYQ